MLTQAMEDTSSFTHACVCNPGTNEKYWTHFVFKKVESCYFNVYLTCNSLASFRCQLVWGAAQKMMSEKIREQHAERKQKNVLRNLTRLDHFTHLYTAFCSGTHNMSAGLWFSVASRCVEK